MAEIAKIENHVELALSRQTHQFKGKPNIEGFLEVLIEPVQRLEDAIYQVLTQIDLDNAIGAQLDLIGKIVLEGRGGKADADYLRYLRAKIKTLRSRATIDELIAISDLIINDTDADYVVTGLYPAGLIFNVENIVLTDDLANTLIYFLRRAVSAAVKFILTWWPDVEDNLFTLARSAFLSAGHLAAVTTLNVYSTTGFPASGELIIDEGTADEEVVTYSGVTATTFTGVSATANAHDQNAAVCLTTSPGLGLGTDSDPDVGGKLIGAKE